MRTARSVRLGQVHPSEYHRWYRQCRQRIYCHKRRKTADMNEEERLTLYRREHLGYIFPSSTISYPTLNLSRRMLK